MAKGASKQKQVKDESIIHIIIADVSKRLLEENPREFVMYLIPSIVMIILDLVEIRLGIYNRNGLMDDICIMFFMFMNFGCILHIGSVYDRKCTNAKKLRCIFNIIISALVSSLIFAVFDWAVLIIYQLKTLAL